jgi:hypothetical protein
VKDILGDIQFRGVISDFYFAKEILTVWRQPDFEFIVCRTVEKRRFLSFLMKIQSTGKITTFVPLRNLRRKYPRYSCSLRSDRPSRRSLRQWEEKLQQMGLRQHQRI